MLRPAAFSACVVLGLATFFTAIAFATAPNVCGTANFGNNLANDLSIAIDPAFSTTEVSFALFNGETFNQSYTVDAFNGSNLVATQTLTNVAPKFNSGYGLIDLISAGGITNVTIAPTGAPTAWDFLIDTSGARSSWRRLPVPFPTVIVRADDCWLPGHSRIWPQATRCLERSEQGSGAALSGTLPQTTRGEVAEAAPCKRRTITRGCTFCRQAMERYGTSTIEVQDPISTLGH